MNRLAGCALAKGIVARAQLGEFFVRKNAWLPGVLFIIK